jgi:hypothetical protein
VGPTPTFTPTFTPKPTLTPGGPPTPEPTLTETPRPGGGDYIWDGGGDGVSWNSPINWIGDFEYPNASGSGASGINSSGIDLWPGGTWQNSVVTVGELHFSGIASIGANVAASAQLVFDNGSEPAVLETSGGTVVIYVPITIEGDLEVRVNGGRLEHHRNLFRSGSPDNGLKVTTTNEGVFRLTQEEGFPGGSQADGYTDFGDLTIAPGSYFVSRNTHWPGRHPLGLGTIRMGNASTLEIQMRAFLPNDFVISGDYVNLKFAEDRIAMGNIEGVISGSARLMVQMEDRPDGGTFVIAGDSRNTYSGGTVINGLSADTQFYVIDKDGATGLGDVTLRTFAKLRITDGGSSEDRIDDLASLYLEPAGNSCTVDLVTGVSETIARLFIDGEQQNSGTWGSSESAAANSNDNYFTGSGVLIVTNAPGEPVNTREPTLTPTATPAATPTKVHGVKGGDNLFLLR